MHDLLGHTLSLIALKGELAGRLIAQEPARAAQEIHEVERVARQSLREVREAVAGYRQPALHSELEGARQLLEGAGIACTLEQTAGALSPKSDAALAWTVREGVTNVIRHSRARNCAIRVNGANGRVRVELINDGYSEAEPDRARGTGGCGLCGLRERVAALGGQLESGPALANGQPGFRLFVEIPAWSSDSVEQVRPI